MTGNTGMDAHADLTRKNQRKRNHYIFDAGWEAKNAMQGIGRDHRSNQKQPPHVILTESNVKAETRFMSSILKRLDQLASRGLIGDRVWVTPGLPFMMTW